MDPGVNQTGALPWPLVAISRLEPYNTFLSREGKKELERYAANVYDIIFLRKAFALKPPSRKLEIATGQLGEKGLALSGLRKRSPFRN